MFRKERNKRANYPGVWQHPAAMEDVAGALSKNERLTLLVMIALTYSSPFIAQLYQKPSSPCPMTIALRRFHFTDAGFRASRTRNL